MKKTWEEATIEEIENYCEKNKTGLIIEGGKVTGEEKTDEQRKSTRIMIASRYECSHRKYSDISAFIIAQGKGNCK